MVAEPVSEDVRVVIYRRVSTSGQARDGASLDTQLQECRTFARERGWLIVGEYDDVMSGKRTDRPGYQSMLAARRHYNGIVVWRFDRLGRDEPEFFTTVAELRRIGCDVYSVKEPNGSPVITGILAVLAANESRQTVERIRPNMERKAEAGHWITRAPYGYQFSNRSLIVHDDQAAVYREMVGWYLAGLSLTSIARRLNERGTPPSRGDMWFGRSIRWMLANPAYIGDVVWSGKTYPGRHQPLIDRATWDAIQANLEARTHEPKTNRPATVLSGFITCRCGYKMALATLRHRWTWYRCAARVSGTLCDNRHHLRKEVAEAYVHDLLAPLFNRPADRLVDQALTLIQEQREVTGTSRERARLGREIDQARRRLAVAREKLLDGLVTDAEYLEDRARYQAQIDAATNGLTLLAPTPAPSERHLRSVATEIKTIADAWALAGLERRRELLGILGLRLTWDGVSLTHTVRRDVALLLGDVQNGWKVARPCGRQPAPD